jgi:hypothetical protein
MKIAFRFIALATTCVIYGCSYPKITDSQYTYSYLSDSETFASTRRSIGEIFIFDPNDPDGRLEILDKTVPIRNSDLSPTIPANIDSYRVSGARITIATDANNSFSGSAYFEAKVDADGFQIRSARRANVSDRIEDLYTSLKSQDPESNDLPLEARRVHDQNLMYAVVSGAGVAEKLHLSHGTPQGKETGIELTLNGKKYFDVKIDKKTVFECAKSTEDRPQCTADVTVYTAKLVQSGGITKFDVKPSSVSKEVLTRLLQNTFSN